MKTKIDTFLLTAILVVLLVLAFKSPPPVKTQFDSFDANDLVFLSKPEKGQPDRFVVKMTRPVNGTTVYGMPFPVRTPLDVVSWLATDGWQLAWTDGKTWCVQRSGNPKNWHYTGFVIAPEASR